LKLPGLKRVQNLTLQNLNKNMKKIILPTAALANGEVLTRSQLKKVLGGDGSGEGGGGDLCVMTITDSNGWSGTTDIVTQNTPGSTEAKAWCVTYIQAHPGVSCQYNCAFDGFGS
jgi:hypothetical protein